MGYKKMDSNLSFADVSIFSSLEHNRTIKRMKQINTVINWSRIEPLVVRNYTVSKSAEGSEAYHHARRVKFTKLIKNALGALFRQFAFNLFEGRKVLG
jgi:hypothetical protein